MHRLLLIDDDEALAVPLRQYLARFDFQLEAVTQPSAAQARLADERFDALILDGMLPEMDGFEFCKRLRAGADAWRDIPILMLTARGDLTDRVVGLELGADDYLPKPFEPRELAARLQTILRRARLAAPVAPAAPASASKLCFDGLEIDTTRREVRGASGLVELTGTEYELLLMLAREPGRVFSRDDILNRLRGQEAELYTRAVDILVSRLRRKLEPLAALKTLRNAGYCFALPVRATGAGATT
jgi:two-component system OmpR family response regulator